MSLGYLRSDALTELANCGEDAFDKIEKATRELLGATPGSWIPDDIISSLELVERAYDNAASNGKRAIILALLRIIDDYGRAWLKRSLTLSESRQLLSAMELGVAWNGKFSLLDSRIIKVLLNAKNASSLFSLRVKAISEILGENGSLIKFVHSLWSRLPDTMQNESISLLAAQRFDETKKHLLAVLIAAYKSKPDKLMKPNVLSDLNFFTSRLEGKPGIIQLRVHDQWRLVGICPILGGNTALEVADDSTALLSFFEMLGQNIKSSETPVLNAGSMKMQDDSRLNLIEGAFSHIRGHFFNTIAEVTAAQIPQKPNAEIIASILWHKMKDEDIPPKVIAPEAEVLRNESDLIHKAMKITESFEQVLTSAESSEENQKTGEWIGV